MQSQKNKTWGKLKAKMIFFMFAIIFPTRLLIIAQTPALINSAPLHECMCFLIQKQAE